MYTDLKRFVFSSRVHHHFFTCFQYPVSVSPVSNVSGNSLSLISNVFSTVNKDGFLILSTNLSQKTGKRQPRFSTSTYLRTNFQLCPTSPKKFSHVEKFPLAPPTTHPQKNPSSTPMLLTSSQHPLLDVLKPLLSILCYVIFKI